MFRALADAKRNERKEGFQSPSSYQTTQTNYFTKQAANLYPTGLPTNSQTNPAMVLADSLLGLGTFDPNTRQASSTNIELQSYATSLDANEAIQKQQAVCQTTNLDEILSTQDPNKPVRCGWIYKKGIPGDQPIVSQGALGTKDGPLTMFRQPEGKWFWDLDEAKEAMMGDRCAAMTTCTDVGAQNFAGCAYSTTRGIGIPVDPNGRPLYADKPALSAPASSLVTTRNSCPPPPPPGSPAAELARSRDICTPLPNGRLSRDCMLQQVTAAGCKMDGGLYKALVTQASPNNYAAGLQAQQAFNIYQQRASNPLLEQAIREGNTTTTLALANFQQLAREATNIRQNALHFAARDLCIKQGDLESFDFCSELVSTTRGPFPLSCLQTAFRKAGGQPAGSMYPTQSNQSFWDGRGTWGSVLEAIQNLSRNIKSTDMPTQRKALGEFMGIQRQITLRKQIGRINGVEYLWFNRSTNTFVGRRVRINQGFANIQTSGEVEGTGLADNVEYVLLSNIRPPTDTSIRMRMTTDDGSVFVLNNQLDTVGTRGKFFDTDKQFAANWLQAPTTYTQTTCWNLQGEGPNYVLGFWQEVSGFARSELLYQSCKGGAFQPFSQQWLTLTQEPDAPMLSWQGLTNEEGALRFAERRIPLVMELVLSPQTRVVKSPQANPSIPAWLHLKGNGNGYGETKQFVSMTSWRTLSMQFICQSNQSGVLLRLDVCQVYIEKGMIWVVWNSPTLTVRQSWPIQSNPNQPYYLYINMRSDIASQAPNRLTLAFGTVQEFISGRINVQQIGSSVFSYTTVGQERLISPTASGKLSIGDTRSVDSANVYISSIRLFDYEMVQTNVVRDIQNAWLMEFI